MSKLETWDFVAVAVYFVAVLATGIYSMYRTNRGTVTGYFLAGRYMTWLPVGASLFASNIGSEHFIGLAGSGAAAGISVGAFELNACILLQLLGWVFFPVFVASGVYTLPEYMKKRFGGNRIRMYLTFLSLVLYIFTKISVNLYAGALFIQQALQWDLYVAVLLILAATALCTVTGGLAAVIYTDTLQAGIMLIGAFILSGFAFSKVGGYSGLHKGYMNAIPNTTLHNPNTTCGYPREDSWVMLRDPVGSDMPWPGFIFGQTPASIWYWCADQMMVQRALAAKGISHAQGGTLFAGFLKLLPVFIMVMPGMISRVLFPDEVGCADPDVCEAVCQNRVSCSNIAYPKLVLELMPIGLRGLMMSVMLAALMSNLTSIFNSASTLFTMDVYRNLRRKASTRELMIVGRVFVCLMVGVGIIWIPVIKGMQGGQLFIYIQVVSAYLSPPIASVYCVAVFWKRGNEKGAFLGLMIGLLVGVVRMILEFVYAEPSCGEPDLRPAMLRRVHYMYFAAILFFLTALVMVVTSLLTAPPPEHMIKRTTFWTRHDCVESDIVQTVHTVSDHTETLFNGKTASPESGAVQNGHYTDHSDKVTVCDDKYTAVAAEDKVLLQFSEQGDGSPEIEVLGDKQGTGEAGGDQKQSCSTQLFRFLKKGVDWFCGLNSTEESLAHQAEQLEREQKLTNLKQDKRTKIGLYIGLAILHTLTIFLFVFFTTGSSFGLL